LGKSWKRFSDLLESGPRLNLEDPVLLFHFFRGLQKDHKQMLHTMSRGSFFRIPTDDARAILDRIVEAEMDNTLHDETHEAEVDTLPNSPSTLAIPSSEPQKEEIPPLDFMLDIEYDLFAVFGNISNYHSIDRPQNDHFSICLPSEHQLRELISVMSSEWLEESELSSDVIHLDTPPITIRCAYDSDLFDALYNLVVGINIVDGP